MNSYNSEIANIHNTHPELLQYRKKRLLKLCFKMFFLGLVILALFTFLYFQTQQIAIVIIGVLAALFCIYRIANPRKNFSKKYGKVTDISFVQKRVNNKNGMKYGYTAMTDTLVLVVSFESPDGKLHEMELSDQFKNCIKKDDVLLRIWGIPYPLIKGSNDMVVCPYCGNNILHKTTKCAGCGHDNIYFQN